MSSQNVIAGLSSASLRGEQTMRLVILCWLTAGCGGFQRAPRRNPIKTRRSVEADPQDSSRAQREELQYGQRSEPDDSFYDELWNRVSALKNREIAADRKTVRNWRAGNSDHLAAVELEDTRVCQTRLNGRTVAFGTAAGVVARLRVRIYSIVLRRPAALLRRRIRAARLRADAAAAPCARDIRPADIRF